MLPGMNAVPQPATSAARRVRLLVIHCSATPSGRWLCQAPGTQGFAPPTQVIDKWHTQRGFARGFGAWAKFNPTLRAIGYHFVIDLDGTVYTARHVDEIGAHAAGFNTDTLGICLVGGAERIAQYTAAQWRALRTLVGDLCTTHQVPPSRPHDPKAADGVCGHRDLSPDTNGNGSVDPSEWLKTCPGFDVSAWLGRAMAPTAAQVCEVPK